MRWYSIQYITFVGVTNFNGSTQALFSRTTKSEVQNVLCFMQRSIFKTVPLGSYQFIVCNILLDETTPMQLASGGVSSYSNFGEAWTFLISTLHLVLCVYDVFGKILFLKLICLIVSHHLISHPTTWRHNISFFMTCFDRDEANRDCKYSVTLSRKRRFVSPLFLFHTTLSII
jgi:hypothetical protein